MVQPDDRIDLVARRLGIAHLTAARTHVDNVTRQAASARGPRGRGTAAAFGFILLFAGLIGGGVLFVLSHAAPRQGGRELRPRRCRVHDDARVQQDRDVLRLRGDGRRRSTCREEIGCEPQATPGQAFGVEFDEPDAGVAARPTRRSRYDTGELRRDVGRPVRDRRRRATTRSPSPATTSTTWAAIGRDPSDGVDEMRRGAIVVAAAGVVLGGLLLALAGWRSKRAATPSIPEGPGRGRGPARAPCAPGRPSRPASRRCRSIPISRTHRPRSHRRRRRCRREHRQPAPPRSPWAATAARSRSGATRRRPNRRSERGPPELPPTLPD